MEKIVIKSNNQLNSYLLGTRVHPTSGAPENPDQTPRYPTTTKTILLVGVL